MGNYLCRRLSIKNKSLILGISLLFGTSTAIANTQINKEMDNKNTLSLTSAMPPIEDISQELIPMPLGQIEEATKKVRSSRDPFQNTPAIESNNLDALKSALILKGLVKTGDKVLAMIQTRKGQEFYEVGDSLGNGFFIKVISQKDVTVDISNGFRYYRLSLYSLNK
tara:strand:+ start:4968 stop:5468 length:501 start_codon:yes stop_codon:yes gene_type:complete